MKVTLVSDKSLRPYCSCRSPSISANDPIPPDATSGTIQGKIVRVDPDRIEVNSGGSKKTMS